MTWPRVGPAHQTADARAGPEGRDPLALCYAACATEARYYPGPRDPHRVRPGPDVSVSATLAPARNLTEKRMQGILTRSDGSVKTALASCFFPLPPVREDRGQRTYLRSTGRDRQARRSIILIVEPPGQRPAGSVLRFEFGEQLVGRPAISPWARWAIRAAVHAAAGVRAAAFQERRDTHPAAWADAAGAQDTHHRGD